MHPKTTRTSSILLLGKTTLPELAQSLSNVTGTAAAAKIPFEDVNAAIAAMTATGAPTAQAITAINQAIVQLINPSKQARDEAERLAGLAASTTISYIDVAARVINLTRLELVIPAQTQYDIAENELIRWLKAMGFRIYDRGWVQS